MSKSVKTAKKPRAVKANKPASVKNKTSVRSDQPQLTPTQIAEIFSTNNKTSAGMSVNETTAKSCSIVAACVKVLSEDVSTLPFPVYERTDKGKERVKTHPVYNLLNREANRDVSALSFRKTMMRSCLYYGNGYAEIERNNRGVPIGLHFINPTLVTPEITNNGIFYRVAGVPIPLAAANVLHIADTTDNCVVGISPIRAAREAIGLALAAEKFGSDFFGGNATPTGIIESATGTNKEQRQEIAENWKQSLEGGRKAIVAPPGITYKQIGISPEDSQFIATRVFQIAEICRWFRVPQHMVSDLSKSAFSNIEQQSLDYITNTLRAWLVTWEQECNKKLFTEAEKEIYFVEHNLDARLRGDLKTRYDAYHIGILDGFLSRNEVREMDGRSMIDGGDTFLVPLNMTPIDGSGGAAASPPPVDPTAPVDPLAPVAAPVDVQASALNGAQSQSFALFIDKAATGQWSKQTTYFSLKLNFPDFDPKDLQELVDSIEVKPLNTEVPIGASA